MNIHVSVPSPHSPCWAPVAEREEGGVRKGTNPILQPVGKGHQQQSEGHGLALLVKSSPASCSRQLPEGLTWLPCVPFFEDSARGKVLLMAQTVPGQGRNGSGLSQLRL